MTDERPPPPSTTTVADAPAASADAPTTGDPATVGSGLTIDVAAVGRWFLRPFTTYWPILLVVVFAFGFRLWAINDWMPMCASAEVAAARVTLDDCYWVGGDASYYHDMAANVAAGEGYTILNLGTLEFVEGADHPPGYITFLAMLDTVGIDTVEGHRTTLAVLGSVSVGLMGLLGWRLGGRYKRSTGVVAALLAAVYPGYWMSDVLYMSEALFVPFAVLTLLCAYRFWRSPGWLNAVWLGAAAGGAWLVRGEAALVLGFIVVGFVLFMREVGFWRRFAMGVVACAVCIGMMTPWIVYNLNRFSEPIFIAATGPALALSSCDDVWYGDATGFYSFGCLNAYTAATVAEDGEYTDAGIRAQASEYIAENITRLPVVMAIRVGRAFGVYSIEDTRLRNALAEGRRQDWVDLQQLMYYGFVAGAIAGLVAMRRRRVPISPIIGAVLAVAASISGTFAIYRYRLAADTALMAACAVGITALAGKAKREFVRIQEVPVDPWLAAEAAEAAGDADATGSTDQATPAPVGAGAPARDGRDGADG